MQRRQKLFQNLLDESCVLASIVLDEVDVHHRQALALLQAEQLRLRAAAAQAAARR